MKLKRTKQSRDNDSRVDNSYNLMQKARQDLRRLLHILIQLADTTEFMDCYRVGFAPPTVRSRLQNSTLTQPYSPTLNPQPTQQLLATTSFSRFPSSCLHSFMIKYRSIQTPGSPKLSSQCDETLSALSETMNHTVISN